MSDLTSTQRIRLLPEQIEDIKIRVRDSEVSVKKMDSTLVEVKTVVDIMNKTIDRLVVAVDDRNEKIGKRVSALETWRNWTTGVMACFSAILLFFKNVIISILGGHP